MLSALLVAVGAWLLFGGFDAAKAAALWKDVRPRLPDGKIALAVALIVVAIVLLPGWKRDSGPTPIPDDTLFSLRGDFVGESASSDASTVGNLLLELADEIEFDGAQAEPELRTGVQIDQLRKAARVLRCRGESIGDRQPAARDKIAAYLDTHVGPDGGPLTPAQRSAWISAFREVGEAATDAAQ